jgi:hypothetical protein
MRVSIIAKAARKLLGKLTRRRLANSTENIACSSKNKQKNGAQMKM